MGRRSLLALLLPLLTMAGLAAAAGPGDIAVFWGRNKDEGTLREACDTGAYNTVIISFLTGFGRGSKYYTLDLSGHSLAGVGEDIKHCKSKGILVLLSIGGPDGNYSLPSPQSAADLADHLWNAFLGGSRRGVPRPFGDAEVDGVDFFIDGRGTAAAADQYYDQLARRLVGYKYNNTKTVTTLTATVRCSYPDPNTTAALATGLFSRVHVRLYGDLRCTWADREAFERWAAAYPSSRMFVGVVASPEADQDAYMFQKDLYYNVLQFAQKLPNYGGLMIWNRYYDKKNHYMSSS